MLFSLIAQIEIAFFHNTGKLNETYFLSFETTSIFYGNSGRLASVIILSKEVIIQREKRELYISNVVYGCL